MSNYRLVPFSGVQSVLTSEYNPYYSFDLSSGVHVSPLTTTGTFLPVRDSLDGIGVLPSSPVSLDEMFGIGRDKFVNVTLNLRSLNGTGQSYVYQGSFTSLDGNSFIFAHDFSNDGYYAQYEFTLEFEVGADAPIDDPCANLPDGSASIVLLIEDVSTGQVSGISRSFDYLSQRTELDFDLSSNFPDGTWLPDTHIKKIGYRLKAPQGFTLGEVSIDEIWKNILASPASGAVVLEGDSSVLDVNYTVSLGSRGVPAGSTSFFYSSLGYIYGLNSESGYPLPTSFDGKIVISCNFSAPECLDDVIEEPPLDDNDWIAEYPFPTTPIPAPPSAPPVIVTPPSTPPVYPPFPSDWPIPPVDSCDCEIYLADTIVSALGFIADRLVSKLDDIRSESDNFRREFKYQFNALNSRLASFESRFFRVDDDGFESSITDVIYDKQLEMFIHVDSNACWYKLVPPAEGSEGFVY